MEINDETLPVQDWWSNWSNLSLLQLMTAAQRGVALLLRWLT